MVFVARYTNDPQADLERGWSAYMGLQAVSPRQYVAKFVWDDVPADFDDMTDAEIVDWLSDLGIDLRYNAAIALWCSVHHDGLSCWALDAETPEAAIAEAQAAAREGQISWSGFGQATVGKVLYVTSVPGIENLHIFECEGTEGEI